MVLFEFALVEAAIKSGPIRSGVPEQPPQALEAAKLFRPTPQLWRLVADRRCRFLETAGLAQLVVVRVERVHVVVQGL